MTALSERTFAQHTAPILIRPIQPGDVDACGRAAYSAHTSVAAAHNVRCEHPSVEFSIGMIDNRVKDAHAAGFVAERHGEVVGSVFLNTFPPASIAAIGPLTVDPAAEGNGAGRQLMQAALNEAAARHIDSVRLVQSPSHLRSLALYIKLGFAVREPLVLIEGTPAHQGVPGHTTRAATIGDLPACDEFCTQVHGFARSAELKSAIANDAALVVESAGRLTGYSTGLGFFAHAVGESTDNLKALVDASPGIMGPGFFVPTRNNELVRWLLDRGFRAQWPATLMTTGPYQEPAGAFLPSIAF
ncbi:GNAT family N-acetyltransferase [Mesorhizobium sp. M0213]|uniref:GNAT family N-acetyltransferase n=1 Tax=Mesorhizobium sp. M0213 TaxID=2956917 RepID=UPI00333C14FE